MNRYCCWDSHLDRLNLVRMNCPDLANYILFYSHRNLHYPKDIHYCSCSISIPTTVSLYTKAFSYPDFNNTNRNNDKKQNLPRSWYVIALIVRDFVSAIAPGVASLEPNSASCLGFLYSGT